MAEQVQAALDNMVAPLADLMDRSVFSQTEIHAIVARRRVSEYLLKRATPRKADFLKYIQDELQLEKLRQLRTKKQQAVERERLIKLGRLEDSGNMTNQDHIGDFHIIQNIHLLFRRTLRKYDKEDVSVYLQYSDVCKQLKSWNKLPEVYAEAVQIHPHCTGLWIEAASHEFFHRQSVSSARILLQRALRINKKAQDLWLQSFALEYHYIAKMKGRRAILEGSENAAPAGKDDDDDLRSSLFVVAKIVYDNAIEAIPDDVGFRMGFLDLCKTFPYTENMEAHIYKTIRRNFQDQPKAWIARANHLLEEQEKQLQAIKEGGEDSIVPQGFTVGLEEDSSDDDDSDENNSSDDENESENKGPAKKRRKSKHDDSKTHEDPILATIQKATGAVATSDMLLESVQFLWMYWEKVEEVFTDTDMIARTRQNILVFMQEMLHDASISKKDLSVYNIAVVLEHAEYFSRVDQVEEAQKMVAEFIEVALSKEVPPGKDPLNVTSVWLRLTDLTAQVQSVEEASRVLERALKHTSISKSDYLKILLELLGAQLTMAKQAAANDDSNTTTIELSKCTSDTFQKVLLLSSSGSVTGSSGEAGDSAAVTFGIASVAQACLHFLMHCIASLGPSKGVRKACNAVLFQSNFLDNLDAQSMAMTDIEALVAFFDKCLKTEISNLKNGGSQMSKLDRKKEKLNLRQLYDAVIRLFKNVPSLATKYQQARNEASLL